MGARPIVPLRGAALERALGSLQAGVYTCDPDGLLTWFNPAAVRIWGREPKLSDPADRYCGSLRLHDRGGTPVPHARCWVALALANERSYEAREIVVERPDGVRAEVLVSSSPVYDDEGRLSGAVNVLVDVSESTPGDPVDRQVTQMSRLVDDLFDVVRMTRGKLQVRGSPVSLEDVLNSAIETARPLLEEKKHELVVRLPAEPVPLEADAIRLSQAFQNLLSNAARYSAPGGRIEIATELEIAKGQRQVSVTVRDEGRGIAADQLEGVFEMFSQVASSSTTESEDGLGIGLALVKAIVELHQGTVAASSAGPGRGSEFSIVLPVAERAARPPGPGSRRAPVGPGRRVLVVDDSRDVALSTSLLLRSVGHEVRTAHDGAEGIEVASRFRPDVVLLDLGLPGIDGYETCRRMRSEPWARRARIIAVTGWGEDEHRRDALSAGFDEILTKPVDPERLRERVAGSGAGPRRARSARERSSAGAGSKRG